MNDVTPLRRNRDFQLLWVGQALSQLGGNVSALAFPLLVLATTHSPAKAGLSGLAATAPFVLLQLPLGAYVDRWNRRATMLVCDAGRALAVGSLVVAGLVASVTYVHILCVAVTEGSFFVAFRLAEAAVLRQVVPDERQLADAIAANEGRAYGTSLAGDPLGGLLFGIRPTLPFFFDAISYLASFVTVSAIRTPLPAPPQREARHLWREIREGLALAWNNHFLRNTAFLTTASDFVINGFFLIAIVIATTAGASSTEVGVMMALGAAGGILGAVTAPLVQRKVKSLRVVVAGTIWVGVPSLLAAAWTTNPLLLGALLGAILFPYPSLNAVAVSRWMAQIPDEQMGRVQAATALLGWAPVPFAPLAGGLLVDAAGGTSTVLIFATILLLTALAATWNPAIRRESHSKLASA